MNRFLASSSIIVLMALSAPASAGDFENALASAWQTNPQMEAARASLRANAEGVSQALSGWLPSVSLSGSAGVSRTDAKPGERDGSESRSLGISLTQSIYSGGGTVAAVASARAQLRAEEASLATTEQTVLLDAITAYVDAIKTAAILKATANNEDVLKRQLDATKDRFEVGELTRTDVSQAEASLASITASRIEAEGNLNSAIATYESVIGSRPINLPESDRDIPLPPLPMGLPSSLSETIDAALAASPAILASVATEAASEYTIDTIKAAMLPNISLAASIGKSWTPSSSSTKDVEAASITAYLSVPLYAGGYNLSLLRAARENVQKSKFDLDNTRRTTRKTAIAAWEGWTSSHAAINAYKAAVDASDLALEGVRSENEVGTRTILDILNAEQTSLDSHVNLINARRNELISAYTLLEAVGRLTARDMGLQVTLFNAEAEAAEIESHWGL